ncbi:MAG: glycoside hydrolase family 3 C-terminal domain-containing protein [Candidatus Solibacter usitatus]|nr:glycoside hydrolase family 3 C-terminal domain-containing protein [Candidatus Solibacter usitatus]
MRKSLALLLAITATCPAAVSSAAKPAPAKRPAGQAQRWLKSMTLREKAAQLLMVQFYGESPNVRSKAYREYTALVRDVRVGGLIVLNRVQNGIVKKADPYQMAAFLNRMQKQAKVPLIVGGDFERGASMRLHSTTQFPHLMAYGAAGDLAATAALGAATGREARAVGVHWLFAPDADVNNNPANPIINIRSFSENPQAVAAHVKAFIEGARRDPKNAVLTTVKHFPGHGDTETDSHIGLGVVNASSERMDAVELVPFRAAIEAGVDSVMTAHLHVPAYEPEAIPATVSKNILTGLLRKDLGFNGLITTDAMDMQGLTKLFPPGEAAVRAVEAGADLLLIPAHARDSVKAIVEAVESGRLSRQRLDQSVLRILNAKIKVGLHKKKLVDLESISDSIELPEDEEQAALVARKALTLVKNDGGLLPLAEPGAGCFYILAAGRFSTQGRELADAIRARAPKARTLLLDPQLPPAEFDQIAAASAACRSMTVAAYASASAYRGSVALAGNYPGFLDALLACGKPLAFVALGNPYLLRAYPGVAAYLATFSVALPSEMAAVEALFGEVEVSGKLPVTIPGLAEFGFGMKMEKRK